MKKFCLLVFSLLLAFSARTDEGRRTIPLTGGGWSLWLDKEASWESDRLYLPQEITDLSLLPVNQPTGGWQVLNNNPQSVPVEVPGTVEEYLTVTDNPRPEHFRAVSWWYRKLAIPADQVGKRFLIHFESVRMRAEVYLDGKLVAYDLIGETPFQVDITDEAKPGTEQLLAVRITNPGGNFHWQDFDILKWGDYNIPPARSFSGIIGRVKLESVSPVYISDIYMQNTPQLTKVNALLTFSNETPSAVKQDLELIVSEKTRPENIVFRKLLKNTSFPAGRHEVTIPVSAPDAKLWDLDTPELYTCTVQLKKGKKTLDQDRKTFGFRWFTADGVGKDAVLRLNGRRVVLRSAISWGYFPVTGLIATEEMAEKQIRTARSLGLNMLNFHRCIGSPVVLEKADELGLLYYEEPGSFHSATHDPFIRTIVNEKLKRMVYRDRSHPSLVIFNLINEFGGPLSRDKELVAKRMNDMRRAHAVDPSRIMTFTSGWAGSEDREEDSKAHMMPFDTTLYKKGWYDNHRAGGPETWVESYYKGPDSNIMHTTNRTEVYLRGEEGAISTPPRIQLINDKIASTGKTGWDGLFWKSQYKAFADYFQRKNLSSCFGSLDALTRSMGNVSFEHQGRRIQAMRMQNLGDAYMVNGWEAMPYDNHSGIVDIYRNPKGDAAVLAYYNQPLYVAVVTRNQVLKLPGSATVDFYIVNEKDLKGTHTLDISLIAPDGEVAYTRAEQVDIAGGETFGQLLLKDIDIPVSGKAGTYRIRAELKSADRQVRAQGHDEVVAVDWQPSDLAGSGAYYGAENDKVAAFYKETTGKELPAFTTEMGRLDWLVVNRSSLDEPVPVSSAYFKDKNGASTLKATWYSEQDMNIVAAVKPAADINRTFVDGAQPDEAIPANQPFSVVWEGEIYPPESGQYLLGVETDRGVRMYVDDRQLIDEYYNEAPINQHRPVVMEAGRPVKVRVVYRQTHKSGKIQLKWSQPSAVAIAPQQLLERVKKDGTTLILLGSAETWMKSVAEYTGTTYNGYYYVGKDWIGGIHFVKEHPLFEGLPVNCALNWPYQSVVRNGDQRFGFRVQGEDLVVGSYRSTPFELGTAVGVIPCGEGKVIFSSLDIADNLNNPSGPAEVARKILCNYIKSSTRPAPAQAHPQQALTQSIKTIYPTKDWVISDYVVTDPQFGAQARPGFDNRVAFQAAIDAAYKNGGGVVYIPAGNYEFRSTQLGTKNVRVRQGRSEEKKDFHFEYVLRLHPGVQLRGDWADPDAHNGKVLGTILEVRVGKDAPNHDGNVESWWNDGQAGNALRTTYTSIADRFIEMNAGTGVTNLSIWYPEQDIRNVRPYPWTLFQTQGDCATIERVTLVNSYNGFNSAPSELHYVLNSNITALNKGIEVHVCTDIGRIEDVRISPAYWANSGLPGAPTLQEATAYTRANATGFQMHRSDWEYVSYLRVSGYKTGVWIGREPGFADAPNAQLYEVHVDNCGDGLYVQDVNPYGILISNSSFGAADGGNAAYFYKDFSTSVQFNGVDFRGPIVSDGSDGVVSFENCTFDCYGDYALKINSGNVLLSQCDFKKSAGHIYLGKDMHTLKSVNSGFKGKLQVDNRSTSARVEVITDKKYAFEPIPKNVKTNIDIQPRPASAIVLKADLPRATGYNNDRPVQDVSARLQSALDAVKAAGGGTLYLPAGRYLVDNPIKVPSGVELRGSWDVQHHTQSGGTAIFTNYDGGAAGESGPSLIQLEANAGIKGITLAQLNIASDGFSVENPRKTPFLIQGQGPKVYIVNVTIAVGDKGIDLASYDTSGHYVDYLGGVPLRAGIWVGGGAEGGFIRNMQFNPHYGSRLPEGGQGYPGVFMMRFVQSNCSALKFADVRNQTIFNNFVYGSVYGIHFLKDAITGKYPGKMTVIGHGSDGCTYSLFVEDADKDTKIVAVNSELVNTKIPDEPVRSYVLMGDKVNTGKVHPNARLILYNSAFWGSPVFGAIINNGIVSFQQANFTRSGGQGIDVRGGKARVYTSYFAQKLSDAAAAQEVYARLGEQGKSIELTNNYYLSGFRTDKSGKGLIYGSDKK